MDNTLYAELLDRYVKSGVVDYRGLKKEEGKLDRYLRVLEKTDPKTLSRKDQFAFYINAYNAWTMNMDNGRVLRNLIDGNFPEAR